jgi:hypothetical protein
MRWTWRSRSVNRSKRQQPKRLRLEVLEGRTLPSFQGALSFDAGHGPVATAVGDFNGDGNLDVVTVSQNFTDGVSLLLGNGDGTFQPPRLIHTNEIANSIVVGDFRHNGKLDIAIGGVQNVVVLLGNGDGTFQDPVHYYAGSTSGIAVGDFTGDGIPDLVVSNRTPGLVGVFQGNGDGTFQNVRFSSAGRDPTAIAVADFNHDGRDDVVVANTFGNTVSVLLGNGDGTFQPPVAYAVGTQPVSLALGDFNGDGQLDLAVANKGGNDHSGVGVSVLLGNSDGTFQNARNYSAGTPLAVAAGGFNGDGRDDLAVLDSGSLPSGIVMESNLKVLLSNPDGTFQDPVTYQPGAFGESLALGDFRNAGILDVAWGNRTSGRLSLLRGNGDGTFVSATNFAAGLEPTSLATGDFNGDGALDLITANFGAGTVSLLFGNGDGTFQDPVNIRVGSSPRQVVVGDFNHDGKLDFLVTAGLGLNVYLGNGDGTFQDPATYTIPGNFPVFMTVADLTGPGSSDLVTLGSVGASVLLNNGDGTFGTPRTYTIGDERPSAFAVGDFDHNGRLDLIVTGSREKCDPKYGCSLLTSDINLFRGNGDGTFQAPVRQSLLPFFPPSFLTVGDFNEDGIPDLLLGNRIFLGNGDGTFRDAGPLTGNGGRFVSAKVADVDNRGHQDLVVVDEPKAVVSVYRGHGDGTFQPPESYAIGSLPADVVLGDFNGDHLLDLVTANRGNRGSLTVLLHSPDGTAPGRGSSGRTTTSRVVASNSTRFALAALAGAERLSTVPFSQSAPLTSAVATTTNQALETLSSSVVDQFFTTQNEPTESHSLVRAKTVVRADLKDTIPDLVQADDVVLTDTSRAPA